MRLEAQTTAMLLVDVQEKLFYHMQGHTAIEQRLQTLIQGLQEMNIDVICNQQYTQGLGETIASIKMLLKDSSVHEKKVFSCCQTQSVREKLAKSGVKNVIVAGVEAHVCVLQTALELMDDGFGVMVCTDAIGSRFEKDYETALVRLQQENVRLGTVESILFELLKSAAHPHFKSISQLVRVR